MKIKHEVSNNSLWSNPRYPLLTWYKYISWFFRNIKYSVQRIRRGYSDHDLYDLNSYLATLLAESLSDFAQTTISIPTEYDENIDLWRNVVRATADSFAAYDKYDNHESMDSFLSYLQTKKMLAERYPDKSEEEIESICPVLVMLKSLWLNTYTAEEDAKKMSIDCGLDQLKEIFHDLWI